MRPVRLLAVGLALLVFSTVAYATPVAADRAEAQSEVVVDGNTVAVDLRESSSSGGGTVRPVTLNSDCVFGGQTVDWLVDWKNSERPEQFLIGYEDVLLAEPAGTAIGYMWCVDIGWGRAWLAVDRPPERALRRLVFDAYAQLEVPTQMGTSAPPGTVDHMMIVHMPTWLWASAAVWQPQNSPTASLPSTTVFATATPVNISFVSSSGDPIDCGDNEGAIDETISLIGQTSSCLMTWTKSTASEDGWLESTIVWDVTYTCTGACPVPAIDLPDIEVTTTREVVVGEIHAVSR